MDASNAGRPIDGYTFVDESKQNEGRYGAVCAVSVSAAHRGAIERELRESLGKLSEFKFNKMSDGDYKRAALRMLDVALTHAKQGHLKIDALSWDRHDSRHDVQGRDDYANLGRMLHHRLVYVLLKWPELSSWHLSFDRQDQIDSRMIAKTVNAAVRRKIQDGLTGVFATYPEILYVTQVDSVDSVFVQLADLFAGLAMYLRELNPRDYKSGSRSKRHRAEVIDALVGWLASHTVPHFIEGQGLIVERLATVNFWPYRPQGDYDRAPTKASSTEPQLVACTATGCDNMFLDQYGLKSALCPTHYGEKQRENEEAEQRELAVEKAHVGSHYCERCFGRLTPTDAMKRVNQSTWEDEYRHPKCGGLLIELDPYEAQPDPTYKERDRSARFDRERPNVKLDRQSYRDDD